MAKDMAGRYLRQMDVFSRRNLHSLGDLLSTTPQSISDVKLSQLAQHVDDLQRRSRRRDVRRDFRVERPLEARRADHAIDELTLRRVLHQATPRSGRP